MWDLETLKRLNEEEECRRDLRRSRIRAEVKAGMIAQSEGLSDDEIFDMQYPDQNDRTGVDD